ncbi:MAG: adenylate/guanylate cyclase domain-containing protein [Alphaproteobacteria bacterium]|nr:adenylate/guanylate cyclase domain-containing protein [Alphaproteobacteria bacterium]
MIAVRKLAAILAADVAGYSRLMGSDENGTLAARRAVRRDLIDPAIAAHTVGLFKTTGDGLTLQHNARPRRGPRRRWPADGGRGGSGLTPHPEVGG